MIVLLNFAPIDYGGGAEKWLVDLAQRLQKHEEVVLVEVDRKIASLYSRVVLKRSFDKRVTIPPSIAIKTISWSSFIPFTNSFRMVRDLLGKARLVYFKFELLELVIAMVFGGFNVLKKSIAGLHSPFYYKNSFSFFDSLHKIVYESQVILWILNKMKAVHSLNTRDHKYLKNKLTNKLVMIPNALYLKNTTSEMKNPSDNLVVTFVGELNLRKGADILVDLVKAYPDQTVLHIVGDGPYKDKLKKFSHNNPNISVHGFIEQKQLANLFQQTDILLLPSRAESFGLVFTEAMAYGASILDNPLVSLELPDYIEYQVENNTVEEYVIKISQLRENVQKLRNNRKKISSYVVSKYSEDVIFPELISNIFEIKV